jgi:hypothetical protein
MFAGILDATGGQYEGFSYLGVGLLLLISVSATDLVRWINRSPDPMLRIVLIGFVAYAISPNSCLGNWCTGKTLDVPITAVFRSSGRFVWPALYGVTAAALALAATRRRATPLLLLVVAWLQWVDTAPLRSAFAESMSKPASRVLDAAAWQHALAASATVRIFPSFSCLLMTPTRSSLADAEIAIEIQLLATILGVPINSVYAARHQADCTAEEASGRGSPPIDGITVYLENLPGYAEIRDASVGKPNCQNSPRMVVCVPGTVGPNPGRLTDTAL